MRKVYTTTAAKERSRMDSQCQFEGINLSYESLSQQKLQLDKLSDDLLKYNLTQNEMKEIMEKSAERSLVILKWKKYSEDHSREVIQTPTAIFQSAKEEHNHSKITVKMMNPQQPLNPITIDNKRHTV